MTAQPKAKPAKAPRKRPLNFEGHDLTDVMLAVLDYVEKCSLGRFGMKLWDGRSWDIRTDRVSPEVEAKRRAAAKKRQENMR